MRRAGDLLLAALLVGLLVALTLWVAAARPRRPGAPYDPEGVGPVGTRALVLLAQRLGLHAAVGTAAAGRHVQAWVVGDVPLYAVGPHTAKGIAAWVRAGGIMVIATREMPVALGEELRVFTLPGGTAITGIAADALTRDVARIDTLRWSSINGLGATLVQGRPLAGFPTSFMAVGGFGKGRVIAVGDPDIFTNRRIGDADHAILAANILTWGKAGRVVFLDPYRLADPAAAPAPPDGLWELAARSGAWIVAVQLAAALAVWAYAEGRRFGPPRPWQEPGARRLVGEYVGAMANLMQRTRARRSARDALVGAWRRVVLPRLGLPPSAGAEAIAERLPERQRALAALWRAERVPASDRELVELARDLEHLRHAAFGRRDDG